ncbi:MAG: precorrin-6A synthase (deacetylating) [Mycobacterium sp.]|uniref:precorrin-6A synthase (deacetylating) n=1 Tax=Mycobacterium sp. TaxID=1785 RepID=UPI003F992D25
MSRHIHVIGIGAGDPDYLTVQAIAALNDTQVFFAMDKGEAKSDLVALRRQICERYIREPGYRFVELPDPKRSTDTDYRDAVSDWHAARARIWATAIAAELGPDGVGAFLAWGDPSLYDSTLRILEAVAAEVDFSFDVIPGITAVQALTARHRIPLNEIGEPVLITTGRQLRNHGVSGSASGSVVVMLDADCSFQLCPPGTRIWWGAYLGTDDELLVAGTVGEVGTRIAALRAEARARHGWIMDTYLLGARG